MASNTEGGHTMSYKMTRPSNVWQADLKKGWKQQLLKTPITRCLGKLPSVLATESRTSGIFEKLSDPFEGNF